ncbi:MAG: hypothetical protein IJW09_07390, partial [Clostridia bacterium]|nr:hypothetical protein [Clostridia bacterium]
IGDDLIADADDIDDADRRPRRPIIIRWSAVACACLAVIVCLGAILGGSKTPIEPWIPTGEPWRPETGDHVKEMSLEADILKDLFLTYMDGTNAYVKRYAPHIGALAVSPIPQTEYLPIYQEQYEEGDSEELEAFIQKYLAAANELYGYDVWEYKIEEDEDVYDSSYYLAELEQNDGSRLTFLSYGNELRFYNWPDYHDGRFQFRGEYISILGSDTDEQIKEKLSDLIAHVDRTLQKNYSDICIEKYYNDSRLSQVAIYLYNAEDTEPPEIFENYPIGSDYILLRFFTNNDVSIFDQDTSGEVFLRWMDYCEYENGKFSVIGKSRMLSLEEAEELLAKGYVFGGHSCKLCMAEQKKVDFMEYDAVSFEYVHGENGMVVPFYTFYKHLGASEYDKTGWMQEFAKTYVPAVEIEGLEEYFDMQAEKHK